MPKSKEPNWKTGVRGKNYSASLRRAQAHGAVICVVESGSWKPVTWNKPTNGVYLRPWIAEDGSRYDSYECEPVFPCSPRTST